MPELPDAPHYERRAFLALVAAGSGGYVLWAWRPANSLPAFEPVAWNSTGVRCREGSLI